MTEQVGDELVIYDQVSHNAHCLDPVAALIFARCEGRLSHAEIALQLGLEIAAVDRAVAEFRRCELLDDDPVSDAEYSRREAAVRFAQIGGAAMAAPLIVSVAIPVAAAAASCLANGTAEPGCRATTNGNTAPDSACCSNLCYKGSAGALTCVPAGCLASSATCVTGAQCCSGTCLGSLKCGI